MRFTAHDPEDGPVTTGLWRSDIDGDLGEGPVMWMRDLSLGTHEITVTISDSDGNVVDLEATVEVVPGSLEAPRVEGAEPDAEMMVSLGPARLDQFPWPEVETEESAIEDAPTGFPWVWVGLAGLLALVLTVGVILARRREVDG
jgi:hypothetical protein